MRDEAGERESVCDKGSWMGEERDGTVGEMEKSDKDTASRWVGAKNTICDCSS